MNKPSYTPGPWEIKSHPNYAPQIYAGRFQVADALFVATTPNDVETVSNARLIAAAPELAEALKDAVQMIEEWTDAHDGINSFDLACGNCDGAIPVRHSFGCRARAALQKAGIL